MLGWPDRVLVDDVKKCLAYFLTLLARASSHLTIEALDVLLFLEWTSLTLSAHQKIHHLVLLWHVEVGTANFDFLRS